MMANIGKKWGIPVQYGLVGASLGHSFSKEIHERLGGYPYELCPLAPDDFDRFFTERRFRGVNVTIPYKQRVIPYCGRLDAQAHRIGAVNTVVNENGVLAGYNTDYAGFAFLLQHAGISLHGQTVLVLGNGGTAKTVRAVAVDAGAADICVASRSGSVGTVTYAEAARLAAVTVVINASPAGMFPDNRTLAVDLSSFPHLRAVADVVYNPLETRLVQQGRELGVPSVGGLLMLVAQAKAAAELFTGHELADSETLAAFRVLRRARANFVLTGMPGSGKSTVGRLLAERMSRPFVDLDDAVSTEAGMDIPQMFAVLGEAAFRDAEAAAIAEYGAQTGLVISTGGGAPLRRENIVNLRQNGVLAFLDRPIAQLETGKGRPLSSTRDDLLRLAETRLPLYRSCADITVACPNGPEACAALLAEEFDAFEER